MQVISVERQDWFHFAWLHAHEKLVSLQSFFWLKSGNCLGSDADSFVSGWEWSTTGKGTGVGMRRPWGALWLPWCRLPSIATTGPDAAAKSSRDTYSKDPSALGGSCFTKGNRSLCRSWDVGPVCCPLLGSEEETRGNPGVKEQAQGS